MATISTANFLAIADNIAKSLVDLESAFISNITSNTPTAATITAGQTGGANSLQARVAGLNDVVQERDLAGSAYTDASNVVSYLTVSKNALYALYKEFMNALEIHTGGVNSFLTTNTLLVHPEFAAAFNYFAPNASALGLRNAPATSIVAANIFVAAQQSLASIAVTGAAAGTFSAGTAINLSNNAPLPLFIKNTTTLANPASAPTLAAVTGTGVNASSLAAGTYTVGYTFLTATGETQLSPTASQAITAGQQINVSSIALPSGATGIKFYISIAAGNSTVGYSGVTLTAAAAVELSSLGASSLPAPAASTATIPSGGTATSLTVTYVNASGATVNATQALSGSLAGGATLAVAGATGSSVSNIVVNSGGVANDTFAIVVNPTRTVTY